MQEHSSTQARAYEEKLNWLISRWRLKNQGLAQLPSGQEALAGSIVPWLNSPPNQSESLLPGTSEHPVWVSINWITPFTLPQWNPETSPHQSSTLFEHLLAAPLNKQPTFAHAVDFSQIYKVPQNPIKQQKDSTCFPCLAKRPQDQHKQHLSQLALQLPCDGPKPHIVMANLDLKHSSTKKKKKPTIQAQMVAGLSSYHGANQGSQAKNSGSWPCLQHSLY